MPDDDQQYFNIVYNYGFPNQTLSFVLALVGAWVKIIEVELEFSITFVIISSIMEDRDWDIAIKLRRQAAL